MAEILIVDDEDAVADVLAYILEIDGHRVQTAGDGREALERIGRSPPDLLLTDLMMPRLDGYELCRTLRAHPAYERLPIVVMTAAPGPLELDGCRVNDVLRKPFAADVLLATVGRALGENVQRPGA